MKSWVTKNNYQISWVLSKRSNVFLIKKGDKVILIDSGVSSRFNELSKNLALHDVDISKISYLILTHTHYDHCQSAKKIKELSNCKIVTSKYAEESAKNGYTVLPKGTYIFTNLLVKLGRTIGKRIFSYEAFQPDILVNDESDLVDDDIQVKIVETQGHSIDSISILVENEVALVGDTLFSVYKGTVFPPFADDVSKLYKSWKNLLETGCDIFLPGHGGAITKDQLKKEITYRMTK